MQIELQDIGKKFSSDWIFRHIDFVFKSHRTTAILGRNGSGKSTLLQLVAGNLSPTIGQVNYSRNGMEVKNSEIFRHLALVAPYQELIEEFTLREMVDFHFAFKRYIPGFNVHKVSGLLGFKDAANKPIRQYSSGMKQRIKLILAFLSDVPLLLLDEPAMHLDPAGMEWYLNLIKDLAKNRTLLICSNQHQAEIPFADAIFSIEDYRKL